METQPSTVTTPPPPPGQFSLTESAAARINELKAREGKPGLRFRVAVKGGGCSGFQYEFDLDDSAPASDDTIIGLNGAEVIVDSTSLEILGGGALDYTEDLAHAGFSIINPNANASCGCGNSFSVKL